MKGIIIFPLFCLLLSFFVLATDPVFSYSLLEREDSIEPTKQLFEYFFWHAEMPNVFNAEEQKHLQDVKLVINIALVLLILLAIALFYIHDWKTSVTHGTLLLFIVLILAVILPFDILFTAFHNIAFPQGGWRFAADSMLINFYPINFFINYAVALAINSLVAALIVLKIVSTKGLNK